MTAITPLIGNELVAINPVSATGYPAANLVNYTTQQIANLATKTISVGNGDGKSLADVTTVATSATISSASYVFTSSDIGKYITIAGAGASSTVLNATIISVTGSNAILSAVAGSSLSGNGVAVFGTDNSTAINAAITTANAAGGGVIQLGVGTYVIASKLVWQSKVSMVGLGAGVSILKWISTSDMGPGQEGVIVGLSASVTAPYTDVTFYNFEIDCAAATMATYSYLGKCIVIQYALRLNISYIFGHDSPATAIGCDFIRDGNISNNRITNAGRLNNGSQNGGAGISWETGDGLNLEFTLITNNIILNACRFGLANEEVNPLQTNSQRSIISGNIVRCTNATGSGIQDNGMQGSIITNNIVTSTNASNVGFGISAGGGTVPYDTGQQGVIANNWVSGWSSGIAFDAVGTISPNGWNCTGNTVTSSLAWGILARNLGTNITDTIVIQDNYITGCGEAGIGFLIASGNPNFHNPNISGNTCSNNGKTTVTDAHKAGIYLQASMTSLNMQHNYCFDNGSATQKYGISLETGATITHAMMAYNHLIDFASGGAAVLFNSSLSGLVTGNYGYNPVGPASQAVGASPWTYTCGSSRQILFIYGGTVSAVVKAGVTLGTSSPMNVELEPGETVTVTYSVIPTAVVDKR